ncbi:hypothetical protein WA026_020664 [Henosepilachna vigintioctopunctata]|uniref:Uncharacterized protein n=1 Tax=Henosepilachna vigintioctopunctata TaxID=420089 RepID=A0AAW1U2M2_9CUCU
MDESRIDRISIRTTQLESDSQVDCGDEALPEVGSSCPDDGVSDISEIKGYQVVSKEVHEPSGETPNKGHEIFSSQHKRFLVPIAPLTSSENVVISGEESNEITNDEELYHETVEAKEIGSVVEKIVETCYNLQSDSMDNIKTEKEKFEEEPCQRDEGFEKIISTTIVNQNILKPQSQVSIPILDDPKITHAKLSRAEENSKGVEKERTCDVGGGSDSIREKMSSQKVLPESCRTSHDGMEKFPLILQDKKYSRNEKRSAELRKDEPGGEQEEIIREFAESNVPIASSEVQPCDKKLDEALVESQYSISGEMKPKITLPSKSIKNKIVETVESKKESKIPTMEKALFTEISKEISETKKYNDLAETSFTETDNFGNRHEIYSVMSNYGEHTTSLDLSKKSEQSETQYPIGICNEILCEFDENEESIESPKTTKQSTCITNEYRTDSFGTAFSETKTKIGNIPSAAKPERTTNKLQFSIDSSEVSESELVKNIQWQVSTVSYSTESSASLKNVSEELLKKTELTTPINKQLQSSVQSEYASINTEAGMHPTDAEARFLERNRKLLTAKQQNLDHSSEQQLHDKEEKNAIDFDMNLTAESSVNEPMRQNETVFLEESPLKSVGSLSKEGQSFVESYENTTTVKPQRVSKLSVEYTMNVPTDSHKNEPITRTEQYVFEPAMSDSPMTTKVNFPMDSVQQKLFSQTVIDQSLDTTELTTECSIKLTPECSEEKTMGRNVSFMEESRMRTISSLTKGEQSFADSNEEIILSRSQDISTVKLQHQSESPENYDTNIAKDSSQNKPMARIEKYAFESDKLVTPTTTKVQSLIRTVEEMSSSPKREFVIEQSLGTSELTKECYRNTTAEFSEEKPIYQIERNSSEELSLKSVTPLNLEKRSAYVSDEKMSPPYCGDVSPVKPRQKPESQKNYDKNIQKILSKKNSLLQQKNMLPNLFNRIRQWSQMCSLPLVQRNKIHLPRKENAI